LIPEKERDMKKLLLFLLVAILVFMSCGNTKLKQRNPKVTTKCITLIENVSQSIVGMQFKEIEVKGASEVFEKYKKLKITIVRDYFLGKDISSERSQLKKIKEQFDELTLEKDALYYVQNGIRENPFIAEFEDQFAKKIILALDDETSIEASRLKIIYDK
jgi:hypothetical protein